jgi:hypothetical protein
MVEQRGEQIKFTPTPKQREAHLLLQDNKMVLYGGAIRGAKSYWGCLEIITFCFHYPNSRWLMLRESMPTIKATLLKTFTENFLSKGFSAYVKDFNQQSLVLTWKNGSQIIFMAESYDTDKDLNRFRGMEINGAFIDEVNEIQEVTLDKVIERSGSWFHAKNNCPTKILMSCNPANNWVKDRFYNPWKSGTLPKGVAYIQAKITDNPHIPIDYLESLKMLPRYQYMAFVEGDWDVSIKIGGEFYKCFELDDHVITTAYNPDLPLHISWDDNVNPYLPCGIFQIQGQSVRMISEIAGVTPQNTVKGVCNEFIRLYPNHKAGLFVYGDATAQKADTKLENGYNFFRLIIDYLKDYRPQLRVLKANPSVTMRGMWINTILEKQINGINIGIDPSCKRTINELVLLKEAADGTKLKEMETDPKTKVRYQKVGHFSDLLDYMLCFAFANEFQQYQSGGVTKISFGKTINSKNSY